MLLLEEIFKQIILETISRDKINNAINNKEVVTIYYNDPSDEVLNGYRKIEVWCYGKNKFGNDSIRAWILPKSVSKSYPPGKTNPVDVLTFRPGWRMFSVSKINSMRSTGIKITQQRPKFNKDDKDMSVIYNYIKIGSSPNLNIRGVKTKDEQDLENVKNIKLKQDRGEQLSFAEKNILNIFNKRNK